MEEKVYAEIESLKEKFLRKIQEKQKSQEYQEDVAEFYRKMTEMPPEKMWKRFNI